MISERLRTLRPWLLLPVLAVVDLVGQQWIVANVPARSDWVEAARFVRSNKQTTDLVTSAPRWTDPILREVAGDMISLADAGRDDTARYDRLWVLSIRGAHAPEEAGAPLELVRNFGRVTVGRYRLARASVLYDFVEHLDEGDKQIMQDGLLGSCVARSDAAPGGAGLDLGPVRPALSWQCDSARGWLWIGATVFEDSDHRPRRCVWTHPAGREPIRITYRDVPLGEAIVVYGGLQRDQGFDDHQGTVRAEVRVDGEVVGVLSHPSGPGWTRLMASTRGASGTVRERGKVTIDVTSDDPQWRHFCWSATTRSTGGS